MFFSQGRAGQLVSTVSDDFVGDVLRMGEFPETPADLATWKYGTLTKPAHVLTFMQYQACAALTTHANTDVGDIPTPYALSTEDLKNMEGCDTGNLVFDLGRLCIVGVNYLASLRDEALKKYFNKWQYAMDGNEEDKVWYGLFEPSDPVSDISVAALFLMFVIWKGLVGQAVYCACILSD